MIGPGMLAALVFGIPVLIQAQPASRVQDHNGNAWFMYFGDHKVSGKWDVHLEGQWRRAEMGASGQQLLLRPAVNYNASRNVMLTAGYAYVRTYQYGDFPAAEAFPEHRIYQQALVRQTLGRARLQHRYRLEQRWIGVVNRPEGTPQVAHWRTQDRFRYMLRGDVPLKGRWSVGAYNELFVNFGRNLGPNVFDQNRAYAALGYNTGKLGRVEVGYMNQIVAQRNGRVFEFNHTVQVAFISTMPFRKR